MLFTLALRNTGRNRRRSILSGIAIGFCAFIIMFMFSLNDGMKDSMIDNTLRFQTGEVRIQHRDFEKRRFLNPLRLGVENAENLCAELAAVPGLALATPRLEFPTMLYQQGKLYQAMGTGLNFAAESDEHGLRPGEFLRVGTLPQDGEREMAIGAGLAKSMNKKWGQKITVLSRTRRGGTNALTFTISAILQLPFGDMNDHGFFIPLDQAQRLLGMSNAATSLVLFLQPGSDPRAAATAAGTILQKSSQEGLEARAWLDIGLVGTMKELMEVSYNFIALFFLLLGSTVIINTIIMIIFERTREIGTMAAMGLSPGRIVATLFLESLIIAAVGSGAGVLLGTIVVLPLSIFGVDISHWYKDVDIAVSGILKPSLSLGTAAFSWVFSVVVAGLISLIPSRRAARIEPVQALRAE